jgi:hypothetical protein
MFSRKHIPALIIAGIILLLYVPWVIPPDANTFIWHRFLLGISLIITGYVMVLTLFAASMPVGRFSPLWIPDNESFSDYIVTIGIATVVLVVLALVTGLLIQLLWTRLRSGLKWPVRVLVVLLLTGNSLFGTFFSYLSGILVEMTSCERFISPTDGILIEVYGEVGAERGMDHVFILTTHDGGKSWQHSWYEASSGFNSDPLCRHLNGQNANLMWTWSDSSIYVSPDAGNRWHYYQTPPDGSIERVEFTDVWHGTAWLDDYSDTIFATSDGGQSWHRQPAPDAPASTALR